MKKLILFSLLSVLFIQANSQSLTVTSEESRCKNSGKINITISAGTPTYSYELYDGPTGSTAPTYPVTIASSNSTEVFNDLIPGKYYIQVTDQNTTLFDSVVVTGDYEEPRFSLGGTTITCPGASTGKMYVRDIQNGRAPFTYQILSPYVGVMQSTDTFFNLSAGTYQVRMYDSCGNYQTRSYVISEQYSPVTLSLDAWPNAISCDSATFTHKAYDGVSPYTYRIDDPENPGLYLVDSAMSGDSFHYDLKQIYGSSGSFTHYRFSVVDACGVEAEHSQNFFDQGFRPTFNIECDSSTIVLGGTSQNNTVFGEVKYITTPNPLNLDTLLLTTDSTERLQFKLPNGGYMGTAITQCGDTFTNWFGYVPPPLDSIIVESTPSDCALGKVNLKVSLPYIMPDWHIAAGPYTYRIFKDAVLLDQAVETAYTERILYDADTGTYFVQVWNACGDTMSAFYDALVPLQADLTAQVSFGCGLGEGSIVPSSSNNYDSSVIYRLTQISPNWFEVDVNDVGFYNLDTGTYMVGLILRESWCTILEDTFTINEYQQPQIQVKQLSCINSSYAIKADASFGRAPYTYFLRDPSNGFSVIRGPVSTDTFLNLTSGVYNILVEDACGNTVNANSSPYTPDLDISYQSGSTCAFTDFTMGADTILQSSYSWTGSNGFSSSDRVIDFRPIYHSDSGQYYLEGNILDGCILTHDTFNVRVDTLTEAEIVSFNEFCFVDSAKILLEGNSSMSTETVEWTVTAYPVGAVFRFDSVSATQTYFTTDLNGDYAFEYTITNSQGCSTSDRVDLDIECVFNQITGTVYLDKDEDGSLDAGESGTEDIWVYLYKDVDNDGIVDIEDKTPLDSIKTSGAGFYSLDVQYENATESYFLGIDTTTLPTGSYLTTDNAEYSQFTTGGNVDPDNDFGHSACEFETGIASIDSGCVNEDVVFAVSPAVSGATYKWDFESGTPASSTSATQLVSWSAVGDYQIDLEVTDATCVDTITKNIRINGAVTASAVPNDTVCRGGEVVLDASSSSNAGVSYLWSVQSGDPLSIDANGTSTMPTVSPYMNTVFKLTVVDTSTGCSNVAFVSVNVNVNLNPTASLNGPTGSIHDSSMVFLDGTVSSAPITNPTATLNYTWIEDEVAMSAWNYDTLTTVVSGTTEYGIVCIDPLNGCADTAYATVTPTLPPVPVELIGLKAKLQESKDVLVTWSTATELNNEKFEVQRRYEYEREFTTIGEVAGAGNSSSVLSYSLVDRTNQWLSPVVYYRLRQVDYDGSSELTYAVPVSKQSELELMVYPNPVQNETTVAVIGDEEVQRLRVVDMFGKDVSGDVVMQQDVGIYMLDVKALRNGTYFVEVITETKKTIERIQVAR